MSKPAATDTKPTDFDQARKYAAGSLTKNGSFNRLSKRMDNRRKETEKLPNPFHILN